MSGRSGTGSIDYPVIMPDFGKPEPQRIMESLKTNNTTSYKTGLNTFSFMKDSSRSRHPLDGNSQLCYERKHDGSKYSNLHWSNSDSRGAVAWGSENDRVKYFRDQQGAGIAWEHRVPHSSSCSSYIETGVRNDNGAIGGFIRWALGFN